MIKLTKGAEFAILVLSTLAKKNEKMTTGEVAKELNVPLNHLQKIVKNLSNGGYLNNSTGRGGGLRLLKTAESINLMDIIILIEGPIYMTNCIMDVNICTRSGICRLKSKIELAQNKMIEVLKETTIKDIM